jgi:hypothetical protein
MTLKAMPGRCEEASPLSHETYVPCNAPAARMVAFMRGGEVLEGPFRMCAPCADHNVRNRGATDQGAYP